MNIYRALREVHQQFTAKDYSSQNTLGKIIPILQSLNYSEILKIDIDFRNALSHGNMSNENENLVYRFQKNNVENIKSISGVEFDAKIIELLDIASASVVAFLKILALEPSILESALSSVDQDVRDIVIKLRFRSNKIRINDIQRIENNKQINALCVSNVEDKESLCIQLYYIAMFMYLNYPNFSSYFVSYDHERTLCGYIRLKNSEVSELIEAVDSGNAHKLQTKHEKMIYDIKDEVRNRLEYKYFQFPEIKERNHWRIGKIEDIGIEFHKRLKAILIIENGISDKEIIKSFILKSVNEMKNLYTPENPKHDRLFGDREVSAIFINVFKEQELRGEHNIFPSNENFICSITYYRDPEVPRLVYTGIMKQLWEHEYILEDVDLIRVGWNPNFS
ncbi:Threonine--tRNA ligase [Leptospira santarosai]|uniref:Threonine--tRNA ligase n=1 Tax=Leptospira santarosai TaxID=28183 RepID=A0A2P1QUK0_9LEPT|nr:Threonine--tRNA ligase [Leptospira santarosai]